MAHTVASGETTGTAARARRVKRWIAAGTVGGLALVAVAFVVAPSNPFGSERTALVQPQVAVASARCVEAMRAVTSDVSAAVTDDELPSVEACGSPNEWLVAFDQQTHGATTGDVVLHSLCAKVSALIPTCGWLRTGS